MPVQNQRSEPSGQHTRVSSQRRAVEPHEANQLQARGHFHEPVSRPRIAKLNQEIYGSERQYPQARRTVSVPRSRPQSSHIDDDEAYARNVQERLYNDELDGPSQGPTQPYLTVLPSGSIDPTTHNSGPNAACQNDPYTTRICDPEDHSLLDPGEESRLRRRAPGQRVIKAPQVKTANKFEDRKPRAPQAQPYSRPEARLNQYYMSLGCEDQNEEDEGAETQMHSSMYAQPLRRRQAPSRQYDNTHRAEARYEFPRNQGQSNQYDISSGRPGSFRGPFYGRDFERENPHNPFVPDPRHTVTESECARNNRFQSPSSGFEEPYTNNVYQTRRDHRYGDAATRPNQQSFSSYESTRRFNQEAQELQRLGPVREPERSDSEDDEEDDTTTVSKRSQKVAKVRKEHYQNVLIGANIQAKGNVRPQQVSELTVVEWWDNADEQWKAAVYHWQLRKFYIAQQDPRDQFDVKRAKGNDPEDITTFHRLWKHWQPSRKDGWSGTQAEVLYRFDKKDYPVPNHPPGYLMHDGMIVLDLDDNPVKDWPELPLCLSSALEGSDIETVRRLNSSITLQDFRARMPKDVLMGPRKDTVKPLPGPTALGNRTTRFRERNACPSWIDRTGSDHLRDLVWGMMSEEQRRANTTRGLPMLTDLDVAELKKKTRGKFLERAGSRALPVEERKKRHAAEEEKLEKLRKQDKDRNEKAGNQRKRTHGAMESDNLDDVQFLGSQRREVPSMPQNQPWPEEYGEMRFKRSRVSEDHMHEDASSQLVQRHQFHQGFNSRQDPFSGFGFGRSGYQPPISHHAGQDHHLQPKLDSSRRPEAVGQVYQANRNFDRARLPNLDNGNAVRSFPTDNNPTAHQPSSPRLGKRSYEETYDVNESIESKPKRRQLPPRPSTHEDKMPEPVLNTLNRPLLPSRRAGRVKPHIRSALDQHWNTMHRIQQSSQDLQGVISPSRVSAADHRQSVVIDLTTRDTSPDQDEEFVDDILSHTQEASTVNANSMFDDPRDNEFDEGAHESVSSPPTFDNSRNSLSGEADVQGGFQDHGEFQILKYPQVHERTPILTDDSESANSIGTGSNNEKENEDPNPQSTADQEFLAPELGTTQAMPDLVDHLNGQEMALSWEQELEIMSQFFDFDAASAGQDEIQTAIPQSTTFPAVDYRFVDPVTEQDQQHVTDALWYTLAEAKLLGGPVDIYTATEKSYHYQWLQLQAGFADVCKLNNIPQLRYLDPWYRSFANWPTPNITAEAFDQLYAELPDGAPMFRHPHRIENRDSTLY